MKENPIRFQCFYRFRNIDPLKFCTVISPRHCCILIEYCYFRRNSNFIILNHRRNQLSGCFLIYALSIFCIYRISSIYRNLLNIFTIQRISFQINHMSWQHKFFHFAVPQCVSVNRACFGRNRIFLLSRQHPIQLLSIF